MVVDSNSISKNHKRIAKNTFFLYIRMFLIMLVSLYTSRVVLKVLGVEDFGIYNVVGGVVAMLNIIVNTLSRASTRFFNSDLYSSSFVWTSCSCRGDCWFVVCM